MCKPAITYKQHSRNQSIDEYMKVNGRMNNINFLTGGQMAISCHVMSTWKKHKPTFCCAATNSYKNLFFSFILTRTLDYQNLALTPSHS